MQFYIVDTNPERSAKLLPDYALVQVQLREGWQILSDIGHRFGVTWDGQNKCYNKHHPLTRSFSCSGRFDTLTIHYEACLLEHARRDFMSTTWHVRFKDLPANEIWAELPDTPEEETAHYLLTQKHAHLSATETKRLEGIWLP